MKAITNTKLILEDGIIFDGAITFDQGRIIDVGPADQVQIPPGAECFDAKGLYTAPGLVDIHNHGAGKSNFNEDPLRCAKHFLCHGETTVLPTLYMDLTVDQMIEGTRRIRDASHVGAGRIISGMYMEGPYMGAFGSFQDSIRWAGPIDSADYKPLVDTIHDFVRVWAIDPSREHIDEFMQYVNSVDPHARFALGHSRATASQCRRVKKYGVRVQTHHGDSGKAPGFAQGTIGAGCDEFTLYDPDLYAELICDQVGIHVAPDMIKMVVRTKGIDRIILITDSMCCPVQYKNNEAEGIAYGPDLNYDDQGHLGGSHLTLENACRNLMVHTGHGLCHAIKCATFNPARMLGMDNEIGSLEPGKRANLIIIDDSVRVKRVFLDGSLVAENGELVVN